MTAVRTSAQSNSSPLCKAYSGCADPTSTAPIRVTKNKVQLGAVDQTFAQSNGKPSRNKSRGCADPTSTAPTPAAKRKTAAGAVDQTSAQSRTAAKRKCHVDCADPTSTAPTCAPKRKSHCGAVDSTSAQSILGMKRNQSVGCADPTSTAPTAGAKRNTTSGAVDGPFLADPILGVMACTVDDLEAVRTASENRLCALTNEHGLTLAHPDVARQAAIVQVIKAQEHQAILNMNRVVRRHPLWAFMKPIAGVGEKQFARLLAVINDPYWNDLHDRPRTMRELRSYCGWHVVGTGHIDKAANDSNVPGVGVAPKRQRGQQSNWNDEARKRVWLIAESCMKQRTSIYRDVYDNARKQYADTTHPAVCVRCGPKGKPAQPGTPRSAGHQHAMALRKVAVAFLADVWRESKRLHNEQPAVNHVVETQYPQRRQVKPRNMIGDKK